MNRPNSCRHWVYTVNRRETELDLGVRHALHLLDVSQFRFVGGAVGPLSDWIAQDIEPDLL